MLVGENIEVTDKISLWYFFRLGVWHKCRGSVHKCVDYYVFCCLFYWDVETVGYIVLFVQIVTWKIVYHEQERYA